MLYFCHIFLVFLMARTDTEQTKISDTAKKKPVLLDEHLEDEDAEPVAVRRMSKAERARHEQLRLKLRKRKMLHGKPEHASLGEKTKRAISGLLLTVSGVFFTLAGFDMGGSLGSQVYGMFHYLFGAGYALVPLSAFSTAAAILTEKKARMQKWKWFGGTLTFLSLLGLIEILATGYGGVVGNMLAAPLVVGLATPTTVALLGALSLAGLMLVFDTHMLVPAWFTKVSETDSLAEPELKIAGGKDASTKEDILDTRQAPAPEDGADKKSATSGVMGSVTKLLAKKEDEDGIATPHILGRAYTPPPLSLLEKNKGRPSVGDVKANANLIKRTLQNFGIDVEMDEVSIGPSVTRYALKPAEGVRLGRITSLQNNLELALAASPVRIEAPIPGKALVGVEVPNQSRTMLGMGTILANDQFKDPKKPLMIALGGDISGTAHYANLAKMPHVLIAGATGSGKSVTIHDLVVSLLYRSGPDQLRFVMIDPKRVELTLYNEIPHLLTPVITDPKKAILALKWLTKEMDRRYGVLETESVRDISSYHQTILTPALARQQKKESSGTRDTGTVTAEPKMPEPMPYIVVIIDELADLMQSYPRELEASIVRLAQMSRAVGIHLVLATQRPSVKVITGLIKANIPARIALQVASQIDSRTILDMGGAENLLGAGDMLYLSGEMSKPIRLQAPYISETELKAVVKYLKDEYAGKLSDDVTANFTGDAESAGGMGGIPESALSGSISSSGGGSGTLGSDDFAGADDDMYADAKAAVLEAGKASTSYLQRKLRIGYSRAARLIDLLEQQGVIGSADGAKPREVLGGAHTAKDTPTDTNNPDDENNEA
jgi:DNA segregation ATPase FtsK/SpoIIIE, S-DNA-T family